MSGRNGESGISPDDGMEASPRTAICIGVLGPFHVAVNGRAVSLTAGRLRALLAALALSPGHAVTVERLAAALWTDGDLPGNVRRSVQTYVARLRKVLGAESIGSTRYGYVLRTEPEHIDALRFVELLRNAASAPDTATERAWLGKALALWRGEPFEGVPSARLEESEASWLLERYLSALERRFDLDLAAGRHRELIVELSDLAGRHPLREPLWMRLLVALGLAGRRAEALARYETIRTRLVAELGVDPDPSLQRVHADLLVGRPPVPRHIALTANVNDLDDLIPPHRHDRSQYEPWLPGTKTAATRRRNG
ncbi:BTAD domain-containing putative transcriptional regulator [Actinomadura sp. 21ATH]|uniref:AfsR/SARP family transcriptional regulator n=1 Tax=Actinomadura sp. 21ATH TaxID=1735444 RepID=UPI0035BF178D